MKPKFESVIFHTRAMRLPNGSLDFAKRIFMSKLPVTGHGVNSNLNRLAIGQNKKNRLTNVFGVDIIGKV